VLTPKNEDGRKFLARVEAEIYDEDPIFKSRDKTLIAVHYARIAERELSDRDKQKMFSYTYKVRLLGTFIDKGSSIEFTTAARKLPTVSYHARHLTQNEVKHILNIGNESGAEIGYLCIGENIYRDKGSILFDVQRLRDKRTMIFAQSGFGKTNLVKILLYHIIGDASYGKLIFDLNGEYFLRGRKTYGLGDIKEQKIKDNLVVYSDKKLPDEYKDRFIYSGDVLINMHKHLTIGDILNFSTGFSEVMKSFLLYLEDNEVKDFIEKINTYVRDPQELHKKYPDFWAEGSKSEKSAKIAYSGVSGRQFRRHPDIKPGHPDTLSIQFLLTLFLINNYHLAHIKLKDLKEFDLKAVTLFSDKVLYHYCIPIATVRQHPFDLSLIRLPEWSFFAITSRIDFFESRGRI